VSERVEVEPILLMYAFRYALGRMTYAVSDVSAALIAHRHALRADWREQIAERIHQAIAADAIGHDTDRIRWLEVARAMQEVDA
jgi:hypothetical protein